MKGVVLWVCGLMMRRMGSVWGAGSYSPCYQTEPPRKGEDPVATRRSEYEVDAYCVIPGRSQSD